METMTNFRGSLIGLGGSRRVGVEIEFGRLDATTAAGAVQRRFGGTIRSDGPHRQSVRGTEFGTFKIELDWDWVNRSGGGDSMLDKAKEMLGDISRDLVPTEVVTPPMPAERLAELDVLVHDLVRLGAQGTRGGLFNGFGVHLNPSLNADDITPEAIRRVLQVYLLESHDLRAAIDVDPIRVLLPFVDPFPSGYLDRVLDPGYAPTFPALIDDYLQFNATRNRELDMLPLFALVDRGRVQSAVSDPLISARPTFHWRLPNADFERAGWSVAGQWSRWLRIERLSLDATGLSARLARRALRKEADRERWLAVL